MVKHLTKHGNSLALVIDRGVLDLLDIDVKTPLKMSTDGDCLVVAPVRNSKRPVRFKKALADGNRSYGRMLKNLAG